MPSESAPGVLRPTGVRRGLFALLFAACAPAAPLQSPAGPAMSAAPVTSPAASAPPQASASAPCACPCPGPSASASASAAPLPALPPDQAAIAEMLREREADGHLAVATDKLRARDGKACLAELDQHDALDKRPEHMSTRAESSMSMIRGECLMLAGRCAEGKDVLKKAYLHQVSSTQLGPTQMETVLDAIGVQYCEGALTPREQLLKAASELQHGSMNKVAASQCAKSYDTVRRLARTVKPRDEDDGMVKHAISPFSQGYVAASCFGRAGDCAASHRAYDDAMNELYPNGRPSMTSAAAQDAFERAVPACKGK